MCSIEVSGAVAGLAMRSTQAQTDFCFDLKATTITLIKRSRSYSSVIVYLMVIIFIVISINITIITIIIFFTTIVVVVVITSTLPASFIIKSL
ncbi:hypothetical protein DPMN_154368 [Dreissena polymorpha]|uniref:Uncharacterized protein n=1 Tax=Dreissena polymorpha TaxID=45954 RepID=A0A9D4FLV0_DREPO|nr:hypothetical protein DPMN_154368 [Dreissena polymorpha]